MRMWMVNPRIMCNKHLLGQHVELHMFIGAIKKGTSMQGYVDNNLLQPLAIHWYHTDVVREMTRRGMNHQSPMHFSDVTEMIWRLPCEHYYNKINMKQALYDLLDRCDECNLRFYNEGDYKPNPFFKG